MTYQKWCIVQLTTVELLPADRREVTLNLDTLKFTDARGKLSEINNVSRDGGDIEFELDKLDSKFDNVFDYYFDENGDMQMLEQGWSSEYAIIPLESVHGEKTYINENNEIKLLRRFPDTIIDANIEIELK